MQAWAPASSALHGTGVEGGNDRHDGRRPRAGKPVFPVLLGILTLLLSACDTISASGYNEPRGYDQATLKLVFSMDSAKCLNRFTYDSKLAPSHPEIVSCDSPDARIRNDGYHPNAPSCIRIDYGLITQDRRAYFCLKYLARVGYCYPAVTGSGAPPTVLLYAPSACDESLPSPRLPTKFIPDGETRSDKIEFAKFVVTDIKSPAAGKHCDSTSVSLQPPEEIEGPTVPPTTSQLVCVAPK